jgi:hypothetical protein
VPDEFKDLSYADLAGYDHYPADEVKQEDNVFFHIWHNSNALDETIEIGMEAIDGQDPWEDDRVQAEGSTWRTLHPKSQGHNAMGLIIVNELNQTDWPEPDPNVPPGDPFKNKALSIILEEISGRVWDDNGFQWVFYQTNTGARAGCDSGAAKEASEVFRGPIFDGNGNTNIDDPPYPGGQYNMKIWGQDCQWSGNGENAGLLICNDESISCQKADGAETYDCKKRFYQAHQHEGVHCEFFVNETTMLDPTPTKTKAISVVLEYWLRPDNEHTMEWVFYANDIGAKAVCDKNGATRLSTIEGPLSYDGLPADVQFPKYPAGDFNLVAHDDECEYKNDGTNPGALFCANSRYDCYDDPDKSKGEEGRQYCTPTDTPTPSIITQNPMVYCEW